jgi:hypothetical protein
MTVLVFYRWFFEELRKFGKKSCGTQVPDLWLKFIKMDSNPNFAKI